MSNLKKKQKEASKEQKRNISSYNKERMKHEFKDVKKPKTLNYIKFLFKARVPWVLYIVIAIISFASAKFVAILPKFSSKIASGQIHDQTIIKGFVIYSILNIVISYISVLQNGIETLISIKSQKYVFSRVLKLPMRKVEQLGTSSLITRITNDSLIIGNIMSYIIGILASIYGLYLIILNMYQSNPELTLYVVPLVVLATLFYFFTSKWQYKVNLRDTNVNSKYSKYLSERLSALKYIKSSNMENGEMILGDIISEEKRLAQVNIANFEAVKNSLVTILDIASILIVFILGGMLVKKGQIAFEDLISIYMYISILPTTIEAVLNSFYFLRTFKGSSAVALQIQNEDVEDISHGEDMDTSAQDFVFDNVSYSYNNSLALDGVTFTIPAGKKTALVGASGSGKTTILKLLERFYEPTSGNIFYGDKKSSEISLESWRKNMGYIIQNSMLTSGTVKFNLEYGLDKEILDSELNEVLDLSRVSDFIDTLDKGLYTEVGEKGSRLSGGQRQRLAIARTLATKPNILLVDEGTANLDTENEQKIVEAFDNTMKDKTSVIIAHNLNTVKNADKIIVLDHGKVVGEGTHSELYENNDIYHNLVDKQKLGILWQE